MSEIYILESDIIKGYVDKVSLYRNSDRTYTLSFLMDCKYSNDDALEYFTREVYISDIYLSLDNTHRIGNRFDGCTVISLIDEFTGLVKVAIEVRKISHLNDVPHKVTSSIRDNTIDDILD